MALSPDQYQTIADEAVAHGVDPQLVFNVVQAESSGNHYDRNGGVLTSPTGARGLMQLEPGTARDMGVNPDDPNDNIRGGVRYLATLQNKYGADNPHMIAAAYNGGPRHVDEGRVSPAAQAYAAKVTQGLGGSDDVDPAFAGLGGSSAPQAPAQAPAEGPQPAGYNPDTDVDPAFAGLGQRDPGTPGGKEIAYGDGQVVDAVTHSVIPMGSQKVAQALGIKAYKADDPNAPDWGSRDMPYYAKPGQDPSTVPEGEYVIALTSPDGSSGQLLTKKDGKLVVEKSFGEGVLQSAMKENNNLIRFGNTITGGKLPMLDELDQKANQYDAQTAANDKMGVNVGSGLGKFTGSAGMAGTDAALLATGLGELPLVASAARFAPAAALPYIDAAAQGAVAGGLLTDKRDAAGVMGDMAFGAAGGAATHGVLNKTAGFLAPRLAPAVQAMRDAGVYLTPGATVGGVAKGIEDKATSLPLFFTGDSIAAGQRASVHSFNVGTGNQVLAPIGERVNPGTTAGHDLINEVSDKIGAQYQSLLPNAQINVNTPQIMNDLAAVEARELVGLPSSVKTQYRQIVFDGLSNRADQSGNMAGPLYGDFDSQLGARARTYTGSTDGDHQALGQALQATQGVFRQALSDQNPAIAPQLNAANQSWAMFVRMRDAASRLGGESGVFTPAQLRSAVRSGDKSAGKGAFARGDALLQDFADAAHATVGNKYPDSGTAGREGLMNLLGMGGIGFGAHAAGMGLPVLAGGAATGAAAASAYATPAGRRATTYLLSSPKFGAVGSGIADAIRNLPPGALAGGYPALRGVGLDQQRQQMPTPPSPKLPKRR